MDTSNLKNSKITLFLLGGHKITGVVLDTDEDTIFMSLDEDLLVASREMVAGVLIHSEIKAEELIDRETTPRYDSSEPEIEVSQEVYDPETNTLGPGNHYGSVLPSDMLIGDDDEPEVSFAVTMSSLQSVRPKDKGKIDDPIKKA
jgi:hypothetical protein